MNWPFIVFVSSKKIYHLCLKSRSISFSTRDVSDSKSKAYMRWELFFLKVPYLKKLKTNYKFGSIEVLSLPVPQTSSLWTIQEFRDLSTTTTSRPRPWQCRADLQIFLKTISLFKSGFKNIICETIHDWKKYRQLNNVNTGEQNKKMLLTWRIVDDPQVFVILLFGGHHPEQHVPRRLPHAVERP